MTITVAELRQNAIDQFFDHLEANGYALESAEAQTVIRETADGTVPSHNDTLYEILGSPYGNCPRFFFLLAKVENIFGSEFALTDAIKHAIYEFLVDELTEALNERIAEQKEEENER